MEREAEQEHRLAVATTEPGVGPEEWTLLKDRQRISERARYAEWADVIADQTPHATAGG